MKTLTICSLFLLFGACTIPNQHNRSSTAQAVAPEPKTAEELRFALKTLEEKTPLEYLGTSDVELIPQRIQTRSVGLFNDAEFRPDGAILKGVIHNTASIASFKDVRLKLSFYSATNSLISAKVWTVYDYATPHASTKFSIRIDVLPEAMERWEVEIEGAEGE